MTLVTCAGLRTGPGTRRELSVTYVHFSDCALGRWIRHARNVKGVPRRPAVSKSQDTRQEEAFGDAAEAPAVMQQTALCLAVSVQ